LIEAGNNKYTILINKLQPSFRDIGINIKEILESITWNLIVKDVRDSVGSGLCPVVDLYECCNEISCSVKVEKS
jgi:hypothetical protein